MKRIFCAGVLLLVLGACKDSTGSGPKVASLALTPDNAYLQVGATLQLAVAAKDASGAALDAARTSWSSLTPQIASVSSSGLVTGVAPGAARITASLGGKSDTVTVNVSNEALTTFNVGVNTACSDIQNRTARVVATSGRAVILEDTRNPAGGFSAAEYQSIAATFDTLIYDNQVAAFGAPSDIDNNGKVYFLYTTAVNEMTPPNVNYVVGGFFYARDLFPKVATGGLEACAGSNEKEMFYLLAPDPQGTINNNTRDTAYVRRSTYGTVPHEFEHLINASRRVFVNNAAEFEQSWLDEGLAHIAEELTFYRASGAAPGNNYTLAALRAIPGAIDALNRYQVQNFLRLSEYYSNPESNSPYADNDELATRGAAWGLLRYSADRRGGSQRDFFYALVNSTKSGLANYASVVGGDTLSYVKDWEVSVYTDDAVPNVPPRYVEPSWNFRDILPPLKNGNFPLKTQQLTNDTLRTTLAAGASAYLRFGVAPATQAELRTTSGGGAVSGSCAAGAPVVDLPVGGSYEGTANAVPVLCFNGGVSGAEFTYIPFFASTAQSGTLSVEVTASGVVPVVGPPSPTLWGAGNAPSFNITSAPDARLDRAWEMRLRERERTELSRLIRRGSGPAFDLMRQTGTAPATLRFTVVRTK